MNYTRITAASLVVATMALVGCGGDSANTDSTALGANDSALLANIAMATRDSGTLTLSDTATSGTTKAPASPPVVTRPSGTRPAPTRTTPATKTPAPTPSAPAPRAGTIASGTSISLASSAKVCTNTHAVGDNVTATTTESISGTNGASIPAGATVNMTATQLKRSENVNDPVVMEFRITSISWGGKSYPVEASIVDADYTRVRDQPQSKDVQKVAIGAAAGAIAGKILGKSTKGAVIGGAAGAAAGAATAAATANYQGCINEGARITVRLDAPLSMTVGL